MEYFYTMHILILELGEIFKLYSRANIPDKGNQEEKTDRETEIIREGFFEKV